jgi:sensor histidine kinase YesM
MRKAQRMKGFSTWYRRSAAFRALLHLAYWMLAWCFTNLLFGYGDLFNPSSLLYSSVILAIAAGISYWVIYFLIPRFLLTNRYGLFLIFLLLTIVISLDLELIATMLFIVFLEKFQVQTFFHTSREIYSLLTGTYFIVFLSVAIKLAEFWYLEQNRRQNALKEKVEAELKLLKSQIHPHFLFNTLNNIYALALNKSEQAPDAVLRLSELLDYLIYHGENETVSLKMETELIRNYIELERLRYGKRLQADFEISGETDRVKLAPLLLLPLVENAFKHGISRSRHKQRLIIRLGIKDGNMEFYVENTVPVNNPHNSPSGGTGLANLEKRLDLLYPGCYLLDAGEKDGIFVAILRVKT